MVSNNFIYIACLITTNFVDTAWTQGRQFVVTFPYVSGGDISGVCDLYVITAEPSANIIVTTYQSYDTYVVTRDSGITIDLPCHAVRATREVEENKGVQIEADVDITVYGLNLASQAADGFLVAPLRPQSTNFVLASYAPAQTAGLSQFFIAANEPSTTVLVTLPTSETVVHTLQPLYTFSLFSHDMDLTGTTVESDKPVSVFSGHECGHVPVGVGTCGHMITNVPPVADFGTEFVVPPIGGRSPFVGYQLRVVAIGKTEVYITGHGFRNLNTREFWEIHNDKTDEPVFVTCSIGCLVVLYNVAGDLDGLKTNPFSLVVTPVERYASRFSWMTPRRGVSGEFNNYVSIIAPTDHVEGVRLNGASLGTQWATVTGSPYSATYIQVIHSQHSVHHVDPRVNMAVFVYGHGGSTSHSYGFPAGVAVSTSNPTTATPDKSTPAATQEATEAVSVTQTETPTMPETSFPATTYGAVTTTVVEITTTETRTTELPAATGATTDESPGLTGATTVEPPASEVPTTDEPFSVIQSTAASIESTSGEETTFPITTDTVVSTPAPVPDDVIPPVQYISVGGAFTSAAEIDDDCRQRHYNSFLQRAAQVVEEINFLLGDSLCDFFPAGEAWILEYGVTLQTMANDSTRGEVVFTTATPASSNYMFYDNHNCGREISVFMANHANYEQPVLPPVAGCPDLTLTQTEWFNDYGRVWRCLRVLNKYFSNKKCEN